MVSEMKNQNWNELYQSYDVESAWTIIKTILTRVFNNHAPLIEKRVKGRHCPWLSNELRSYMNERDKAQRKAKKSKRYRR